MSVSRIRRLISKLWLAISKSKRKSKELSIYLFASILSPFISVIINPLLAANLSPTDYAIIGYFTSFNLLALPVISFSFLAYYTRYYFKLEESQRHVVLNTLILSQLIFGFGLLIVSLGVFKIYMQKTDVDFPFFPYTVLFFAQLFFSCFYNFLLVEKRLGKEPVPYLKLVVFNSSLNAVFAILFVAVLKMGAIGRFYALFIPAFIMGVISIRKLLRNWVFDFSVFWRALKFGWPISLSSIFLYFLSGVDKALLEPLNDNYTFGIYNVGVQISAYLVIFYRATYQSFEPDLYKAISDNNRRRLIGIAGGVLILNFLPVGVFILLAHPIVSIMTHGLYTASTPFAQILAIKTIPMAACFLVSNIIIGYGYSKVELVNRAIGASLSFILLKYLIGSFGFLGAAWGQSFSFVLMTLISLTFVFYKTFLQTVVKK